MFCGFREWKITVTRVHEYQVKLNDQENQSLQKSNSSRTETSKICCLEQVTINI